MPYPQCTVARPKADFAIRVGGKGATIKFRAGEKMWVMTPAHAQAAGTMIGKMRQQLGCGYYFSAAQCEELFNFEPK